MVMVDFLSTLRWLFTGKTPRQFVTFQQLIKIHPGFSINTLRHHRAHNTDGFNDCVYKAGRRLYVDLKAFETWVAGQ